MSGRILSLLLLATIVIVGQVSAAGTDMISMHRGPCFGACPVYNVTIFENGSVFYSGEDFVAVTGDQTAEIDPLKVKELISSATEEGFFMLPDAYTDFQITDMPEVILTVRAGEKEKTIVHYHGDTAAPDSLFTLEDSIDLLANTSRWIGEGEEAGELNGSGNLT